MVGENYYVDNEMLDALNNGTKKSFKYLQKLKSKNKKNIIKSNKNIRTSDNRSAADIDNMKMESKSTEEIIADKKKGILYSSDWGIEPDEPPEKAQELYSKVVAGKISFSNFVEEIKKLEQTLPAMKTHKNFWPETLEEIINDYLEDAKMPDVGEPRPEYEFDDEGEGIIEIYKLLEKNAIENSYASKLLKSLQKNKIIMKIVAPIKTAEKENKEIKRNSIKFPSKPYKLKEATEESIDELEKLQKEWANLAAQGKDLKDVDPRKWVRLKFLVNEYRDKIASSRRQSLEKHTNIETTKFEKTGTKGLVIKQKPMGGEKVDRFMGSLLAKQTGERYPFLIRRYPTFFQMSVNPDLPDEIKKQIDLGKIASDVIETIAKKFENKYNKWAFDIIRKESGGHAGITTFSGLGTIGIVPQKLFATSKLYELFRDQEFEDKVFKQLGQTGLGKDDINSIIQKTKQNIIATEKARDMMHNIEELENRLKKLKTSEVKLKDVMPIKWTTLQYLKEFKNKFAKEREKIMNELENELVKIIEEKFASAKIEKKLTEPKRFKITRPDTQKEIIQRLAK